MISRLNAVAGVIVGCRFGQPMTDDEWRRTIDPALYFILRKNTQKFQTKRASKPPPTSKQAVAVRRLFKLNFNRVWGCYLFDQLKFVLLLNPMWIGMIDDLIGQKKNSKHDRYTLWYLYFHWTSILYLYLLLYSHWNFLYLLMKLIQGKGDLYGSVNEFITKASRR